MIAPEGFQYKRSTAVLSVSYRRTMVSNLLSTRAIRVLGDRIDPYYPNIFSVAATGLLVVILLGTTRERFTYAGFAQVTFARVSKSFTSCA